MERFHKIWTTALAAALSAAGLVFIFERMEASSLQMVLICIVYFVALLGAFVIHIIAHEGGHCIGGLFSGYEFASFRVFNFMVVKRDGRCHLKKFHIVGTGGQCLMAPPQPYRPDYPYRLYNLSGGLTNLIIAAVCVLLYLPVLSAGHDLDWMFLILNPLIVAGVYCGVTNLFPMTIGGVNNDGWNLLHLGKDPVARRILWLLLDVMAIINRGGQFRDLPEEWFLPAGQTGQDIKPDYGDTFQCALGVYRFNYLEDVGRMAEAQALAETILAAGDRVSSLYRYELTCEVIFLELIGEGRLDKVERLYTPALKRYIKLTDSYPQRQRLHYAMALLYHRDEAAAAKALEGFKKACRSYPNDGEISSEWELIGLVDCKLAEVKALADDL
jgi:hypothetical protein